MTATFRGAAGHCGGPSSSSSWSTRSSRRRRRCSPSSASAHAAARRSASAAPRTRSSPTPARSAPAHWPTLARELELGRPVAAATPPASTRSKPSIPRAAAALEALRMVIARRPFAGRRRQQGQPAAARAQPRALGHHVATAENGRVALEHAARASRFDLVLLDMEMPEMDGFQVMEQLAPTRRCATCRSSSPSSLEGMEQSCAASSSALRTICTSR